MYVKELSSRASSALASLYFSASPHALSKAITLDRRAAAAGSGSACATANADTARNSATPQIIVFGKRALLILKYCAVYGLMLTKRGKNPVCRNVMARNRCPLTAISGSVGISRINRQETKSL